MNLRIWGGGFLVAALLSLVSQPEVRAEGHTVCISAPSEPDESGVGEDYWTYGQRPLGRVLVEFNGVGVANSKSHGDGLLRRQYRRAIHIQQLPTFNFLNARPTVEVLSGTHAYCN